VVFVTNRVTTIVLCFDHDGSDSDTNVGALLSLLDTDTQLTWRSGDGDVADGYRFLIENWRAGDPIFVFGGGTGAFRAQALTRLLDTVGMLDGDDDLLDYAVANWAMPHTHRTPEDWDRLNLLAAELRAGHPPVPVRYLGLWDSTKPAGLQSLSAPTNVVHGRHALAIDERRAPEHLVSAQVEEVWFRGAHIDVTGATGATASLARIALDWVLDGARRAGLRMRDELQSPDIASPTVHDALSVGRRTPVMGLLAGFRLLNRLRSLPEGAAVHASVDTYLTHHGDYWYRLPHCLTWVDTDWPERGERLIRIPRAAQAYDVVLEHAS
jgi:Uncharacterized alpha/beta hydrolase domain (DUF2235)